MKTKTYEVSCSNEKELKKIITRKKEYISYLKRNVFTLGAANAFTFGLSLAFYILSVKYPSEYSGIEWFVLPFITLYAITLYSAVNEYREYLENIDELELLEEKLNRLESGE